MKLQRTHMASRKILLNCFIARNVKSLPEDTVQMKHMAAIKKKTPNEFKNMLFMGAFS